MFGRRLDEGRPADERLVQDGAQRIEILAWVRRAYHSSETLGRHVGERAVQGVASPSTRAPRQAEVGELESQWIPRHEDVRRLEVRVHDAVDVQEVQGLGNVAQELIRVDVDARRMQVAADEQLHGVERGALLRVAEVEHLNDAGMREAPQNAKFGAQRFFLAAVGVFRAQELERDLPMVQEIFRLVDLAGTALAQQPSQAEAPLDPTR